MDVVHRDGDRNQVGLVVPALGEQWAQRPVDHARGQRRLLAERPSRLKKEPGIFPAEYIRSSTSTVSGRKSTSRWPPAVAVERTIVSPWRTTTAPEACLAILPVSNEISLPAISTETRVTALLLILNCLPSPPVGRRSRFLFILVSERVELSGRYAFFSPPRIMCTGGRSAGEGA